MKGGEISKEAVKVQRVFWGPDDKNNIKRQAITKEQVVALIADTVLEHPEVLKLSPVNDKLRKCI